MARLLPAKRQPHATELVPDVVVVDLHPAGISGNEAIRAIRATNPNVAVLVLNILDDDTTPIAALRAGANGSRELATPTSNGLLPQLRTAT